jgi:hypothetical protein
MFPELGSGVGSQGENLHYKRQLLRDLVRDPNQTVLDIGCGDLAVSDALPSLGGHPKPANEGQLKGSSALLVDGQGDRGELCILKGSTLLRRSRKPLRPYICRLSSLSRCTCPSTWPLLQGCSTAAVTAA